MKKLFTVTMILGTLLSTKVMASPSGFYLVKPSQLSCEKGFLTVTYSLPCGNEYADEWSDVILSYDDSGDREVVVGVAAALSECEAIKGKKRVYSQKVNLNHKGFEGCDEQTFAPMTIAK